MKSKKTPISAKIANQQPVQNAFLFAESAYKNAANQNLVTFEIDFPPLKQIISASFEIYKVLNRDEEFQRNIGNVVWRLQKTASLSLLPFEDTSLCLAALTDKIEQAVDSLPEIDSAAMAIRSAVDFLLSGIENPKRVHVQRQINNTQTQNGQIALIAGLHGPATPGWPHDTADIEIYRNKSLMLVRNRKVLSDSFFETIIFPGDPTRVDQRFLIELLYGGRSSNILILKYRGEAFDIPRLTALPKCNTFINKVSPTHISPTTSGLILSSEKAIYDWVNQSALNDLKKRHLESDAESVLEERKSARFVLFANATGTFIPADGHVVEISKMFDLRQEIDRGDDKLPRKSAADLEEGDLVMLRLSGSGDYLDDVANEMMVQANEANLRVRALDWKDRLSRVLKKHGEGVLARELAKLGIVRTPQYLWNWASGVILAPKDYPTFSKLLFGLNALDPTILESEIEGYARAKWDDIQLIKSFQKRAGMAIRSALIDRVRDLIATGQRVDTFQEIELTGLKAGKMGLLRVAEVDAETMSVPSSLLFSFGKVARN